MPERPGEIRISVPRTNDEHLTMWLPEIIWRDTPGCRGPARPTASNEAIDVYSAMYMELFEEWKTVPWLATPEGGIARSLEFVGGYVSATATPVGHEVIFEITVANESSRTWRDCWAEACLRLAPSASFADTSRRRTLGRIEGEWTVLSETPATTMAHKMNIYNATPEVKFVERCLQDWGVSSIPVQLDHSLIAVGNRSDSAVIGLLFERCAAYCNNLDADMACIHSDPFFGDIEPGSAATNRGKLMYLEGSVAEFIQNASAVRV